LDYRTLNPLVLGSNPRSPILTQIAMASSKDKSSKATERVVYREFGGTDNSEALERGTPDLPPNQQNIRVEASSKGRKGKTVTIVRGFQSSPERLAELLKKLKTQCGAGGTIKDNEIEIQGDHKQKIIQSLIQQGYKAKGSGG
jgi:translation initiation factor 1